MVEPKLLNLSSCVISNVCEISQFYFLRSLVASLARDDIACLFTQVASFAFAKLAAETFLYENVKAFLKWNDVDILDDLTCECVHEQVACLVGRDAALLHIEQRALVELSDG